MHHYLYKTVRDDGFYYIGVHSTENLDDGYIGSGTRLIASIRKHGKQAHSKTILETFDTREQADNREAEIVTRELLRDPLCLNLATGGKHSAHEHRLSTRQKMSASATGKPKSEEHKRKIAEALRGKKRSVQHCANLAKAAQARVQDPNYVNPWSGEKGSRMVAEQNRRRAKAKIMTLSSDDDGER